jgi:hypothetical protein
MALYSAYSPYYLTGAVNNEFLDIMVDRPLPKLSDDILWTITNVYNLRPDMLAYDLYGDSKLWWVFAQRNPNRLKDPLFDFISGTEIYLPKQDTLAATYGL